MSCTKEQVPTRGKGPRFMPFLSQSLASGCPGEVRAPPTPAQVFPVRQLPSQTEDKWQGKGILGRRGAPMAMQHRQGVSPRLEGPGTCSVSESSR